MEGIMRRCSALRHFGIRAIPLTLLEVSVRPWALAHRKALSNTSNGIHLKATGLREYPSRVQTMTNFGHFYS